VVPGGFGGLILPHQEDGEGEAVVEHDIRTSPLRNPGVDTITDLGGQVE
jgi:hypothetical protein